MGPASNTASAVDDQTLRKSVADAGDDLRTALGSLLDELAGAGVNAQRTLQNTFKLSQSATSRLMAGARSPDPLVVLTRVPGPEGLRKVLRGASRAGVKPACLDRVRTAITRVEQLIDNEVGDRYTLDALLSDWVHESRPSFELRQRAAAFKAMSALRGVHVRTFASCWLIHPSDQPGRFDSVQIDALLGCRRVRPHAVMHTTSQHLAALPRDVRVQGLAGQDVQSTSDIILPEFSTIDPANMQTLRHAGQTRTLVHELPLGKSTGADIVSAIHYPGLYQAKPHTSGPGTTGVAANVEPPARTLIFDVLLHDDVWQGVHPELRVFDTVVRGLAHPDDPLRQHDQLEVTEQITPLGRGLQAVRTEDVPRYIDLVQRVCESRGWDGKALRCYRVRMKYPVYGAQVGMAFSVSDSALSGE